MNVAKWTALVADFTKAGSSDDTRTERLEALEGLADKHGGDWYQTGGNIYVGRVLVGDDHLAIVGEEELSLWATGQGDIERRYEITYEQASGYEPILAVLIDGTLRTPPSTDDRWQRCSADTVSAGMLVDLGDELVREGEPREVISTQRIDTVIHLQFNDDDPGAKFNFDELVWVRDKALEPSA